MDAMARLQLARALAVMGDTAKAKSAYNDLLTLWKDADPDIPEVIAAKARGRSYAVKEAPAPVPTPDLTRALERSLRATKKERDRAAA